MWEHAVNENAAALAAAIDDFDAAIAAVDNSDLVGAAREEADKWLENCTSDAYRFRANANHREVENI